jgi:hypothetical protein
MKRTHNEDYFSFIEDEQLFIVADGMGGHASGEVASKMAAETISEFYQRTKDEEATWPFKMDRSLSYLENRLVCGSSRQPAHLRDRLPRDSLQGHGHHHRRLARERRQGLHGPCRRLALLPHSRRRDHPAHPRPLAARRLQRSQARHDRGGRAQLPPQERHHPSAGHARDRAGRHQVAPDRRRRRLRALLGRPIGHAQRRQDPRDRRQRRLPRARRRRADRQCQPRGGTDNITTLLLHCSRRRSSRTCRWRA